MHDLNLMHVGNLGIQMYIYTQVHVENLVLLYKLLIYTEKNILKKRQETFVAAGYCRMSFVYSSNRALNMKVGGIIEI